MPTLFLDLETYCETPISHGTHRYAETVEITVAAWAWDDNAVIVDDATIDNTHSLETLQSLIEQADRVIIHNSSFDRTVLHHNGIVLPPEKVVDTMVLALAHSLPGSLGKLCDVLNVPTDKAKDKDGKRLIQLFCQPRPKKQKLRRATRETHPEEWQKFLDYARLDIEAMRAVYKRIPKWNWTAAERELWLLDQKINDRGVAIDMDLVRAAISAVDEEQASLAEQTQDMTLGVVGAATQRDALMTYIANVFEIDLADLRGVTIEKLLEDDRLHPDLRDLLAVRLKASTTSTAKYKAFQKATSSDGRLRGTLQFCGASRTGRAAGRLVQLQNLVRPNLKNDVIEGGIELLKCGAAELATDNVMELTSNAIRGCIIAPPGKKLVVADLSNIEGRVLAWLAGEDWKLDAFRQFDAGVGHDLYKLTAGKILGKPPEDVTKAERQSYGKTSELSMGYQGGVGAFLTFAAAYGVNLDEMAEQAKANLPVWALQKSAEMWEWMTEQKRPTFGLSQETWIACDAIKQTWRDAHRATVDLWKDLETAVINAVECPDQEWPVGGHITVIRKGAWLKIIMPSGRALSYPAVRVEDRRISYTGVNQYTRQWGRIGTYGGKIAENGTQFAARDVFFASMIPVETAGYEIITHVHDELICEAPDSPEFNAEHLASIMSTNPSWAKGLPLAAAGFETYRYKKED
jgi:DNA polymerase bacteriophage-type